MRKPFSIPLMALFLAAVIAVAGSCHRGRVLGMNEFSEVYEEMLLADQWLSRHPEAARAADTSWFYQPIFDRHGIDVEDFRASLSYYISEPDKFSKALDHVQKSIVRKRDALGREIHIDEILRAEADSLERLTLIPVGMDTVKAEYHVINATRLDTVSVKRSLKQEKRELNKAKKVNKISFRDGLS